MISDIVHVAQVLRQEVKTKNKTSYKLKELKFYGTFFTMVISSQLWKNEGSL